jgi:hypothetical protein
MAEKPKSYKELVENLNNSLAEARARAPAETRSRIDQGYKEVVHKLGHLLTVGATSAQTVYCEEVLDDGTVTLVPATLDYCQQHHCTPKPRDKPPPEL